MSVQETDQGVPTPRPVRPLAAALCEEFQAIHGVEVPPPTTHAPNADLDAYYDAAWAKQQTALCLSGGGIRSASFSLGALQALARKGLLARFHYLSTVSGGGYIGGWLTALVHGKGGDVAHVQAMLAAPAAPPEITALRGYTNFLTPAPGLASPDTWAGVLLWLRNTLVNWLLFLPALFAIALLPMLYADALATVGLWVGWPLLLAGLLCLGVGVYNGAAHLPSHAGPAARQQRPPERAARFVLFGVVLPVAVWATLVPGVAAPSLRMVLEPGTVPAALIPLGSFVVMVAAYLIAGWRKGARDRALFRSNFVWWALGSLMASVLLGAGLAAGPLASPVLLAVLGPLWVTVAHLVQSLLFVALRGEAYRGELDREWLARVNAYKVVPALLWAGFAACCLLLPHFVLSGAAWHWAVGLSSGPVAALIGRFSTASPTAAPAGVSALARSTEFVAAAAALVFGVVLAALLASVGKDLADAFALQPDGTLPGWRAAVDAVLIVVPAGIAYALGARINVNRFSMHAVYRNRLVRAFLGSARTDRAPDGFTGLDPADNLRMADCFAGRRGALFPVVNVTLNMTASRNTAWAERKAESFTITPCHSGAAFLRRSEDARAGRPARGAYAATAQFAGVERETGPDEIPRGITLGTAITLSGAAVSPAMGYHSSPAVGFLMTLFNVRLGAWLPNPAVAPAQQLGQAKPPNALLTLGRELASRTDDTSADVYLTDGGHFDNLGLYEMVRRRCRHIVVIDVGEDPDAHYADLGDAVRKIAIDFDIRIRFAPSLDIGTRGHPVPPARSFALAEIDYGAGRTGTLLYIKSTTLADTPADVRAYAAEHDAFPNETTVNQWFSESQFESYRRLGEEQVGRIGQPTCASIGAFFDDARKELGP